MDIVALDVLHTILTLGILAAGVRLAWIDLKKIKIEMETLTIMAIMELVQSSIYVDIF